MIIEYSYYETIASDNEFKDIISQIIKFPINTISVLPHHIKSAKSIIPDHIHLSCAIDYPLGILDPSSRYSSAEFAIKNGAKIIEITCPTYFVSNRKYDKFREDIKNISMLCYNNNVEVRYILEYRLFSYELLYKLSQILISHNISTIYPSTSHFLDDISDNIIAAALINKKVPEINIIITGNIWNENQIKTIQKANLYGLRLNSLNGLKLATKNIVKS